MRARFPMIEDKQMLNYVRSSVLQSITLRRLAAEIGLSETTLKNWINGRERKGAGDERYHRLEMANYLWTKHVLIRDHGYDGKEGL
jgi:hypothetical protein